ncbi:MAG: 3'-5' exonuclease [Verrucomicrobiota bacterium]
MAQLFPQDSLTRRGPTPGERRFGRLLKSHLEDDYLVWHDVPIGWQRRQPDFVILHPGRGLLVLEVKDWKAEDFKEVDKDTCLMAFGGKYKRLPNPLCQARGYVTAIVGKLGRDEQLCHSSGRYQGKLSFPWGYGAVFPNITRKQWNALLPEEMREQVLPDRLLICKDEMAESVDPLALQERLWGMFTYNFGQPMTFPQIERVRWHMFPEYRITETQSHLFDDEPAPDVVKILDLQQEQLARSLGDGHRVIHGVAGSGKTLILGCRCVQIADSLAKPALVLCYNISLAARLRGFIRAKGLEDKVRVHHFHEWCGEMLRTYHVEIPGGSAPLYVRQVEAVISGVEKGFIPRAQYGAVLIDEGHDFEPEWLKLVTQMLDPATDSLLLLYDDAQSIYRKGKGLGFSLSSVGIKAAGRTTILRLNYRNTREILQLAYDLAKDDISPSEADEDHVPLIEPEAAGVTGSHPVFRRAKSFAEEIDYAIRCVRSWQKNSVASEEIAIVCFRKSEGIALAQALKREGIDHHWLGSSTSKKSYDPSASKVTVITAASSKGLEFEAVVVVGVGGLSDDAEDVSTQMRLLYVAMTRAKRLLAVSSSGENCYSERLAELTGEAVAA